MLFGHVDNETSVVGSTSVSLDMGDDDMLMVGRTSYWVAYERGLECARDDALYQNSFSEFLGNKLGIAEFSRGTMSWWPWPEYHITWMAVRTRYIDDRLIEFCAAQHPDQYQYVALGSGMDARAYRIDALRTARSAIEVDLPHVVKAFDGAMESLQAEAKCPRVGVPADLTEERELQRALNVAGFDPHLPTFWLLEGLTAYFSPKVNESLLSQIDQLSAPGSQMCAGFSSGTPRHFNVKMENCPVFSPAIEEYTAMLQTHGWTGSIKADRFGDPALNYGRYPSDQLPDAFQCIVLAQRPVS